MKEAEGDTRTENVRRASAPVEDNRIPHLESVFGEARGRVHGVYA